MPKINDKFVKIGRTCVLYLSYFALGLCVSVPGPTLIDLQHAVKTDTKHIAFIYSSRSTGYLVGSLLGGIFFDLVKRKQKLLIICNFFMALASVATPWSPNLGTLAAAMAGGGIAMGALDTGGNVWLLNIWGKESAPFLQALHFAFGFGGFIGPLIAAPFLSEEALNLNDNSSESNLNASTYNQMNISSTIFVKDGMSNDFPSTTEFFNETDVTGLNSSSSNLVLIYTITGGFSFFVTVLFVLLYIFTTKEENHFKEKKDENVKPPGKVFTCVIVFLTCLLIFLYAGIEIGYAQMLVTSAVKGNLKLSKSTGSFMTSMFWGTFTFSRGLGIFLSLKFSCLTLMIGDLVLSLIAGAILLIFGSTSEVFLWIGTALLGVSLASFFPSAISWVEKYIIMNNKALSTFCIGGALGEMVIPLLISQFVDTFPEVLFYAVECSGIICSAMLFVIWLIARRKGAKSVSNVSTSKDTEKFQEEKF